MTIINIENDIVTDVDAIAKDLRKANIATVIGLKSEVAHLYDTKTPWEQLDEDDKDLYRSDARWLLDNYVLLKKPTE